MLSGLASGLGTAFADALYASIAAFGVTVISSALDTHASLLELIGGLLICLIGIHEMLRPARPRQHDISAGGMAKATASAFALTLTNPATIVGFAALFSALGLKNEEGHISGAFLLVSGVFTGSILWWLILSTIVHHIRHLFEDRTLRVINLVSGIILLVIGLLVLAAWFARINLSGVIAHS